MTLLERPSADTCREGSTLSSRPSGWCCVRRASRTLKPSVTLANDRRVAENTAAHSASLHAGGRRGVHRRASTPIGADGIPGSRCRTAR